VTTPDLAGRTLLVRSDAAPVNGTGHLMRCLALAQQWLDLGGAVRWHLADAPGVLVDRIAAERIGVVRVTGPSGGAQDGAGLAEALAGTPGALAVVDGYHFGAAFLDALGAQAERVLLVDDLAALPAYPVGWVLNQNAHADRRDYPADSPASFLLGIRYVLMRREFRAPAGDRPVPPHARRVLVTFGGADPTGMTARVAAALRLLPQASTGDLEARLIVGAANPAADEIERAVADAPWLAMRRAVADMPAEIRWADLAVTSGGTTVWELARYGCPALVAETVPAETRLVEGLRRLGLDEALGPETELNERKIADAVAARLEDAAWRTEMRSLGMRLVDGDGARRVALALAGEAEKG
jgi:UDP-2,4-diacetamido-2,4,6-trideoxy-beta-L-altropyranose hydrolase